MMLRWFFGIFACSLLMLIVGARQVDAREGSSGRGSSGHSGTGRLAQRNQDQAQRDADQQKAAEEAKQKAEAKKQAAAKKAEVAKKKADALATAKKATDTTKKPVQAKPAQPDTTEQDAAKLCEQAEKKFDEGKMESILAGASLLQQVVEDFGSTDVAAKAQARLDQLLSMPDFGPKLMLAQANDLFGAQRYRKAQNAFTALVDAFPNSPEAAEGKTRLAEIRNGNLLEKTVYTEKELEDARLWLLAGNIHQENSRPSDAASAWHKVVEDYPGCRFAQEAVQHLAAVPKP